MNLFLVLLIAISECCWALLPQPAQLDSCYLTSVFGRPIPLKGQAEFNLSEEMCGAAWRVQGHVDRFAAIQSKLKTHSPLTVAVFGGSVSCGRNMAPSHIRPDRLCATYNRTQVYMECKHEAYPARIQQALDILYPVRVGGNHSTKATGSHRVLNFCHSGMGTDKVVTVVAARHKELLEADLVIVETSSNDVNELAAAHSDPGAIVQYTEILVRQLLWLSNRPAIVYLHAAWRISPEKPPFHIDAAEQHRHVLDYYNIPQVSVMAVFQPLYSAAQRKWVREVYFNDKWHPSRIGHFMIASILVFILRQAMAASIVWNSFAQGMYLPSEIPVLTDVPLALLQRYEEIAKQWLSLWTLRKALARSPSVLRRAFSSVIVTRLQDEV